MRAAPSSHPASQTVPTGAAPDRPMGPADPLAVLERVADGVYAFDRAWVCTYVNAAAEGQVARSRDELVGRTLWELFPAAGGRPFHDAARQVEATGTPVRIESSYPLVRSWSSSTVAPAPDGYTIVVRDVTDRRAHEERLRYLEEAGQHLSRALDPRQMLVELARLAVPALGDWCAVYLPNDDDAPEPLVVHHADPAKAALVLDLLRREPIRHDAPSGTGVAFRTDSAQLFPVITDELLAALVGDPERLALVRGLELRSGMSLPMVARGESLGVIGIASSDARRCYDEADLAFGMELAGRAAAALDNARLVAAERRAREETERLQALAARLAAAPTPADAVAAVLKEGLKAVGAVGGAVVQIDGDAFELAGSDGYPEEALGPWRRFPRSLPSPVADAVEARRAVWVESAAAYRARYGRDPELDRIGAAAWAALPLIARGELVGALALSYAEPPREDAERRRFAETVADLCAQALDRARLYDQLRQANDRFARAEAAAGGFSFSWDLGTGEIQRSDGLTAVLGYRPEELAPTWDAWAALIHPDDQPMTEEQALAFARGLAPDGRGIEYRVRHKDGEYRWLAERLAPVFDAEGNVRRIVGQTVDVTERKRAEERDRALAAIVTTSDDAIVGKRLDGTVTSWNPAAERLFGWSAEEMIGRSIATIIPPERRDDLARILGSVGRGERVAHHETVRVAKDGRRIDVSISVSPLIDRDGRVIGASKIARDVTARKRADVGQQLLAEAGAALASTLDEDAVLRRVADLAVHGFADWCWVDLCEPDGEIRRIAVSHADPALAELAAETMAYPPRSRGEGAVARAIAAGEPLLQPVVDPAELAATARTADQLRVLRGLDLRSLLVVPMTARGYVLGAITLAAGAAGRRYDEADLAVAQELARRCAMAVDNARLYEEAQRAVALRDDFIAVASHELKTPVTTLKVYAEILRRQAEGRADGRTVSTLLKIGAQVDRLMGLVADLLDVSKIETGKLALDVAPVDLDAVVAQAVEAVAPTAPSHRIVVAGRIGRPVAGDAERIGQVVTNLLTNAVKYSPRADRVAVRLLPGDDAARVEVEDVGIGIEAEHLARIFDRFYRVDGADEKTFPGLGMGLYIAREIVRRHGGEMTVVSAKGAGSTFAFTLPYAADPT